MVSTFIWGVIFFGFTHEYLSNLRKNRLNVFIMITMIMYTLTLDDNVDGSATLLDDNVDGSATLLDDNFDVIATLLDDNVDVSATLLYDNVDW